MLVDFSADIQKAIFAADAELRSLSVEIHENPELALKEFKAFKLVTDYLEAKGFAVERGVAGLETAFVASYRVGTSGPVVSYCSEYDALPNGHSCGHNLICIAGIAAALGTKAVLEKYKLNGGVILYGTPGEEGAGGKITMIEAGLFKRADVNLMIHGGIVDGAYFGSLASQIIFAEYHGKPAHAAGSPWDGRNALDASTLAYSALAMLRQHITPAERIHGIWTNGGAAPNVVPDFTSMKWVIRSDTLENLDKLRERVLNCFEAGALATGTTLKISLEKPYADLRQNSILAAHYQETATRLFDTEFWPTEAQVASVGGSTDEGNVSYELPSLHPAFSIGIPWPADGSQPRSNHTEEFRDFAKTETAHLKTLQASVAMSVAGTRVLYDPAYLEAARVEFSEKVKKVKKTSTSQLQ